jgi:hypothetical protein
MWDMPCYRWAPAKSEVTVEYYAGIAQVSAIPETVAQFEALTI